MNIKEKLGLTHIHYNLLLPGLLTGFFLISFLLNQLSHYFFDPIDTVNTIRIQLPVDHSVVNIPDKIAQFEEFEVSLQLSTEQLARRINDIISSAAKGTAIHGITGSVSSNMSAEVIGSAFKINHTGPQSQLIMVNNKARWTWRALAEESGRHMLVFRLHLVSRHNGREDKHIVDIAQANLYIRPSTSNGLGSRVIWVTLFLIILAITWRFIRSYHR